MDNQNALKPSLPIITSFHFHHQSTTIVPLLLGNNEIKLFTMLDQLQSPLFRLARELRDAIYEHYTYDEKGLFYDYASDRLRYECQSKQQDRNALTRSCKQAAEEIQGAAMRANTITFLPARSHKDGVEFNNLSSKAGRFERLLQTSRRMKMHILHHVARSGCVTNTILDEVAARFPGISRFYRAVYSAIEHGQDLYEPNAPFRDDHIWRWQTSATLCEAIQHTLDLASSHPAFDDAAARASSSPFLCYDMMPPFLPGSHKAVLAWNPPWWLIPTESDLALESHLADPMRRDRIGYLDRPEPVVPVAWYFSAAAIAINFLQRLPRVERMRLRETIIINEDKRGVGYPESHVRGLSPFLTESPHLRLELHVGFWNNLMHLQWLEPPNHQPSSHNSISKVSMLRPLADFLEELSSFMSPEFSIQAIKVFIEGQKAESVGLWEMIKHAASLQEALVDSDHFKQHHDIDRSRTRVFRDSQELLSADAMRDRFQLPCDLPPCFYPMVRNITQGDYFIRFDGDPGELWDAAGENLVRKTWSPDDFAHEWTCSIGSEDVPLPPGGKPAFLAMYEYQALSVEMHPWIWRSTDGSETYKYTPSGLVV